MGGGEMDSIYGNTLNGNLFTYSKINYLCPAKSFQE